jgi:hypothetical protein
MIKLFLKASGGKKPRNQAPGGGHGKKATLLFSQQLLE